jgi:hypothetical protein
VAGGERSAPEKGEAERESGREREKSGERREKGFPEQETLKT